MPVAIIYFVHPWVTVTKLRESKCDINPTPFPNRNFVRNKFLSINLLRITYKHSDKWSSVLWTVCPCLIIYLSIVDSDHKSVWRTLIYNCNLSSSGDKSKINLFKGRKTLWLFLIFIFRLTTPIDKSRFFNVNI